VGPVPKVEGPGVWLALWLACESLTGCTGQPRVARRDGRAGGHHVTIQTRGSDSMSVIAVAWADEYSRVAPRVQVEVSGGGTATGFAALIQGSVQVANASRPMEPDESKLAGSQHPDLSPHAFLVGYDAVAVVVHRDNAVEQISVDQLRQIYAEDGRITRWSQLGVDEPHAFPDQIVLVSRQSSSGTYEFFREHVLGNHDFRRATHELDASKEVVALVSVTPAAIGFVGMGHVTSDVKALRVVGRDGRASAPTSENALNHKYPLARPLFLYTLGEPKGPVKEYVDWVRSEAGQRIVASCGYVPLPKATDQHGPPHAGPGPASLSPSTIEDVP
jgi:phosphate transport system substrate-binding protein